MVGFSFRKRGHDTTDTAGAATKAYSIKLLFIVFSQEEESLGWINFYHSIHFVEREMAALIFLGIQIMNV